MFSTNEFPQFLQSFKKKGALLSRLIDTTINQVPRNNYSKNNAMLYWIKQYFLGSSNWIYEYGMNEEPWNGPTHL